jgi:hypothetical protein
LLISEAVIRKIAVHQYYIVTFNTVFGSVINEVLNCLIALIAGRNCLIVQVLVQAAELK